MRNKYGEIDRWNLNYSTAAIKRRLREKEIPEEVFSHDEIKTYEDFLNSDYIKDSPTAKKFYRLFLKSLTTISIMTTTLIVRRLMKLRIW